MKLKQLIDKHLKAKNLSLTEFIQLTGIKKSTFQKYYYDNRTPNLQNAVLIYEATQGKITYNCMLSATLDCQCDLL